MELPFGRARELESQVDAFLDTVVKTVLELKEGVRCYLASQPEEFENRIKTVGRHEHQADDLRKRIKTALYAHSLIPESRGDVLGLLENLDDVVNDSKHVLQMFEVQPDRFDRQQVDRDGVTVEGVHRQDVKILPWIILQFLLQRDAGVAQHDLDIGH